MFDPKSPIFIFINVICSKSENNKTFVWFSSTNALPIGIPGEKIPSLPEDKIIQLRIDLIKEELKEFQEAIKSKDLLEIADALTDILYVTYGAGHSFGIDLDKCFNFFKITHLLSLVLSC